MSPDTVERLALLIGLACAVCGLAVSFISGSFQPIALLTFGFAVVGAGLFGSRVLAGKKWHSISAEIIDVKDGDPPTFFLRYEFQNEFYRREVAETSSKGKGDTFPLLVNPERPTQSMSASFGLNVLAILFLIVGSLTTIGILSGLVTPAS